MISGLTCCKIFSVCVSLASVWVLVSLNFLVLLVAEMKREC